MDGFMVHSCLVDQSVTKILIVQDSEMNITTCPSALSEDPFVINRSVMIMSDPRGPRMKFGECDAGHKNWGGCQQTHCAHDLGHTVVHSTGYMTQFPG